MNPELRPISSILRLLAIFMTATLLICACSRPPRHQKAFDRARAVMDSLPEQALLILDSIPTAELDPGLDSARYILLHALAEDKTYTLTTPDSTLHLAIGTLRRLDRKDDLRQALYLLGCRLDRQERYNEAIGYLIDSENFITSRTSPYEKGLIYNELAECCNATLNGELALKYIQMAYENYQLASKPFHVASALYEKATFLNNNGQCDKALNLFNKVRVQADSLGDEGLCNAATAGIAYAHMGLGNMTDALAYFSIIPQNAQAMDNQALALRAYAESQAGDKLIADSISHILLDRGDYRGIYGLDPTKVSSQTIIDAYADQDKFNEQRYLTAYKDRYPTIVERNFLLSKDLLNAKLNTQRFWIISLIAILSLSVFCTVFMIKRHKEKLAYEEDRNLLLSNDFIKFLKYHNNISESISKQQSLAISQTGILSKKHAATLHQLIEAYYSHTANPELTQKKMASSIERLLDSFRNDKDILTELENTINICYENLIIRLRKEIPELTEKDMRLFIFLASNLSSLILCKIYKLDAKTQIAARTHKLKNKIIAAAPPSQEDFLQFF